jgi:hypothetical protein
MAGGRAARSYLDSLSSIGALYADSIEIFADQLDAVRSKSAKAGDPPV